MRKIEWAEVARRGRNHAVLMISQLAEAHLRGFPEKTLGSDYRFKNYRQFDGARWISRQDLEEYSGIFKEGERKRPGFILGVAEKMEAACKKARKEADGIAEKNFGRVTPGELPREYEKFAEAMYELCGTSYHYIIVNKFYPEELEARVAAKLPDPAKRAEALKHLFAAGQATGMRKEKVALARIAALMRRKGTGLDGEVREKLREHEKKYAFLGMYLYYGAPYEGRTLEKRLREEGGGKVEDVDVELRKSGEATRKIARELGLDKETQLMIRTVKKMAFVANELDESYGYLAYKGRKLLEAIGKLLGVPYNELIELSDGELRTALKRGEKLAKKTREKLRERYEDSAIILDGNKIEVIEGEQLKKYRKKEEKGAEEFSHLKELRGQCASPGSARGKVRVIAGIHDLAKVRKGDVLVASATVPAFVPAMEKACAIVTDEGGLLSHAAIVGRELGVPCVVGTKVATKALRDGELVEVDATNGLIRKVK